MSSVSARRQANPLTHSLQSAGGERRVRHISRQLDEALARWWSASEIMPPVLLRDGLLALEAGYDLSQSQLSLLLRSALHYRRGMLTALYHQDDAERTAHQLKEALLVGATPLPLHELNRLLKEDSGSLFWRQTLKNELLTDSKQPLEPQRSRAIAALLQLDNDEPIGDLYIHIGSAFEISDGSDYWSTWRIIALSLVVCASLFVLLWRLGI